MPKFVFAYHGGRQFETQEEGAAFMAKWQAWSAGVGDAFIDPGMPVGPSKTVGADGVSDDGGSNPLSGISILQAETMEDALAIAKTCPHIENDGTIEVAQGMDMEM